MFVNPMNSFPIFESPKKGLYQRIKLVSDSNTDHEIRKNMRDHDYNHCVYKNQFSRLRMKKCIPAMKFNRNRVYKEIKMTIFWTLNVYRDSRMRTKYFYLRHIEGMFKKFLNFWRSIWDKFNKRFLGVYLGTRHKAKAIGNLVDISTSFIWSVKDKQHIINKKKVRNAGASFRNTNTLNKLKIRALSQHSLVDIHALDKRIRRKGVTLTKTTIWIKSIWNITIKLKLITVELHRWIHWSQ